MNIVYALKLWIQNSILSSFLLLTVKWLDWKQILINQNFWMYWQDDGTFSSALFSTLYSIIDNKLRIKIIYRGHVSHSRLTSPYILPVVLIINSMRLFWRIIWPIMTFVVLLARRKRARKCDNNNILK